MSTPFRSALLELSRLAAEVSESLEFDVNRAGRIVLDSLLAGGKILVCGNGGSAADAQHFVAELVARMEKERESFPAISLSSDPSVVTATANDYGYERLFARQVEGFGRKGDVLIALTTSGRSRNILRAIETAHERDMKVIVLTGRGGDPILEDCAVVLRVPSGSVQLIQEIHMPLLHGICAIVEGAVEGRSVKR